MQIFAQELIADKGDHNSFSLVGACIYTDLNDHQLVQVAARHLQDDISLITGYKMPLVHQQPRKGNVIIIGSADNSTVIRKLEQNKRINNTPIRDNWENYRLQTIEKPFKGIQQALVITGSDRRGTAFGVFELSKLLGVSPWYWWADVPVSKKENIYLRKGVLITDAPKVKYRGIFINDEAPALSNWSREKFGGFNHLFYQKVFELMLRLKSNYIWPAMWGNAFYDDDSLNIKMADDYGIVIGTSHHEPLMRAHDEWRRYGTGLWNYDSNAVNLRNFWKGGMQRATNEKIVSVGMRGDGDEPMTRETATALLEKIVKDQRNIIEEASGKPADQTPQLWALYKEVQDYYDKGMRVPDDVTLLLCDDNWGNIRRLPKPGDPPRKGGYGIYYHFDYVGGPRNYKWINTNAIERVWEQMHLAWQHGVKEIWIVNVGDIKPMEFPISFFLDYAWDPEKINADDLNRYTVQWAASQFGEEHANEIAEIISLYTKYNARRKPELLDEKTYSIHHYGEADRVVKNYNELLGKAVTINQSLPVQYRDAFFQLVLHPVKASANLHEMYLAVAKNHWLASKNNPYANHYADKVKEHFEKDSLITLEYHQLNNGKWNHMMSQTHIGYTHWQQPPFNSMPKVTYVSASAVMNDDVQIDPVDKTALTLVPPGAKNVFIEKNGYLSIHADHFTHQQTNSQAQWKILPGHGKTGNAITPWPVTAPVQKPGNDAPYLEYEIYVYDTGTVNLHLYFSPTLSYYNLPGGMKYGISVDDEAPQLIGVNAEDHINKTWEKWVADNIIIKSTQHYIDKPGKHTIRFWMVDPGLVLQKIVMDLGGLQPSYLGPPETIVQ